MIKYLRCFDLVAMYLSKEMIVQFDLDDTGTISFEGFLAMISSLTAVMDIEKELHCGMVYQILQKEKKRHLLMNCNSFPGIRPSTMRTNEQGLTIFYFNVIWSMF